MSKNWSVAVLAFVLTIGGAVFAGAQWSQTTSETYTWNGEFVSLDTTAKTMTVKSRVAYQDAISELKYFKTVSGFGGRAFKTPAMPSDRFDGPRADARLTRTSCSQPSSCRPKHPTSTSRSV